MADMRAQRFALLPTVGRDVIEASIAADLAVHNRLMNGAIEAYSGPATSDVRRMYGTGGILDFVEADEFTRPHTQKVVTGSSVDFPLKLFQASIGWTAMFFKNKTLGDLEATQSAAKAGHTVAVIRALQRAFYPAANYTTNDFLVNGVPLSVKRFVNGDSAPIPLGPNGEVFNPATHTHYLFHNALDNASAHALVDTVTEHRAGSKPVVYINLADATAWAGLTDFKPFPDPRLTVPLSTTSVPLQKLDLGDQQIGLFGAAVVWVKPWAIANYAVCIDIGAPEKPVALRTRTGSPLVLEPLATNIMSPIQADYMMSEYGFGVWNRVGGAVLDHRTGAVAYVDPTIP
jgi:hypothetical protein